jgi:hypothetical protein
MTTQGTNTPRGRNRAASPGRNGFRYRQQFGVIVICTDERHQARTFAKLKRAGYRLRVVTV